MLNKNVLRTLNTKDIVISEGPRCPAEPSSVIADTSVHVEHACGVSVASSALRSQNRDKNLALVVLAFAIDLLDHVSAGALSDEDLQKMCNNRFSTDAEANEN